MRCVARVLRKPTILMAKSPMFGAGAPAELGSVVQQSIELRPDLVFLRHGLMARTTLRERLHLGSRGLRFGMIEVEVAPAATRLREPLRVLDGHVGAVEGPGEIT